MKSIINTIGNLGKNHLGKTLAGLALLGVLQSCDKKNNIERNDKNNDIELLDNTSKNDNRIQKNEDIHIADLEVSVGIDEIERIKDYLGESDQKETTVYLNKRDVIITIYKDEKFKNGLYIVLKNRSKVTEDFYVDQDIMLDSQGFIKACGGFKGSAKEIANEIVNITYQISNQINE